MFLFFDGTLFWILLGVSSIGLFSAIQSESPGWCTFILATFLICLQMFSPHHPLSYLMANPLNSLMTIAAYFCFGALYCIVKWKSYVHQLKDKYNYKKATYLTENPLKTFQEYKDEYIQRNSNKRTNIPPTKQQTDELNSLAEMYANDKLNAADKYATSELGFKLPKTEAERLAFVGKRKDLSYAWIVYWPFSFIGTIIDDPMRRLLRFIYSRMVRLLTSIVENAFKDV